MASLTGRYKEEKKYGKTEAEVVSAKELTPRQIESIRGILEKKTGLNVEIKVNVDPDLIGGFYAIIDGRMFDGTVRNDLKSMKDRLKRGSV